VQTWQTALDDALDHPSDLAVGSGYGYYRRSVLVMGLAGETLTRESTYMSSLHSSPLQLLLEFGLLGVVLGTLWLVTAFRSAMRARRPLTVAVLGGAVGLLCSQAFDNALFSYAGIVFAALMAIAESESTQDPGLAMHADNRAWTSE
jgi:O-antigen ligase